MRTRWLVWTVRIVLGSVITSSFVVAMISVGQSCASILLIYSSLLRLMTCRYEPVAERYADPTHPVVRCLDHARCVGAGSDLYRIGAHRRDPHRRVAVVVRDDRRLDQQSPLPQATLALQGRRLRAHAQHPPTRAPPWFLQICNRCPSLLQQVIRVSIATALPTTILALLAATLFVIPKVIATVIGVVFLSPLPAIYVLCLLFNFSARHRVGQVSLPVPIVPSSLAGSSHQQLRTKGSQEKSLGSNEDFTVDMPVQVERHDRSGV